MLRVLIVDDEPLARMELKRLLAKEEDLAIVGECENGKQAQLWLAEQSADLVFLDIQMPELSGLDLASSLDSSVRFVFCTAYSEHAVDAFSLNAFDYIVKPIVPKRLAETIAKARKSENTGTVACESAFLAEQHGLLLKFGTEHRIVRLADVERFESVGNHVALYTSSGKAYLHVSLSRLEKKLDPMLYFKASRSDIVRVDSIIKIEDGLAAGSLLASLKSGQEIEVSRRQAHHLRKTFSL